MATLELRNVKKSYGEIAVVHGIDLQIKSGEFCVFVGPSGCGKSTLLRMIAGLEKITAGDVVIDDEVVNDITAAKRGLAMVFQSYALYPHMSVRKNLSFGLQNVNMPKPEIERRITEAARILQLEDYLDRKPGQLSGGQRQRVAIGRALVREPRIFLFDEPLSNLDAELRVATRGEISDLHERLGNTMIYVTHDQVEAMTMADKIAVLRAGRLEQFGTPLDIFNRPANLFVAGFIGSPQMNFLHAGLITDGATTRIRLQDKSEFAVPADRFGHPSSRPAKIGVRPGDLKVSEDGSGIPMVIDKIEQLGTESFLYGSTKEGETLTVSLKGQTDLTQGETVVLALDHTCVHVFDAETGQNLRVD